MQLPVKQYLVSAAPPSLTWAPRRPRPLPSPAQERLAEVLNVPANRQRISHEGLGFLHDELSLAHYNVSPDVQLQLGVKERGGRKK